MPMYDNWLIVHVEGYYCRDSDDKIFRSHEDRSKD